MNNKQKAVEQLYNCGFGIVPIKPGSKEPAMAHGVKDAILSVKAARHHYQVHPQNNIGISGEGFIIFDFDCHGEVDGRETLAEWEAEHGPLPETLAQTTPSGGYHLIYRSDKEVRPSVNQELAVDVRAWGSYVVCDPTPGYCWEIDPEPDNIADADEQVLAFLEYVKPAKKTKQTSAKKGGRNEFLFSQGRSWWAKHENASVEELRAYLHGVNQTKCEPPLRADEVEKVAGSVASKDAGLSEEAKEAKRGQDPNHLKYGKRLIKERHACLIEGKTPAVMSSDNKSYRLGWDAITMAHLDLNEGAKMAEQKEVRNYIYYRAPKATMSRPTLIAFKNGVLDIETMELHDWSPEYVIPNVIPHNWNPNAQCDTVDRVLARISVGDPIIEMNLCEFAGLCMYRDSTKYGYMAILLGRKGQDAANGKSTYIKMLANMLGSENYSSMDLRHIGEKFGAAYLVGMLANLGDDISAKFVEDLSVVKKAITGDEIQGDVKHKEEIKFKPYATFVFSANQMPKLSDTTDGVLRRLFPIRFNAHFTPNDKDYDPDISDKLRTEEAAERLIYRGVEGLRRVLKNRQPTPNADSQNMTNDIRVDNNNVLQWAEYADVQPETFIGRSPSNVYQDYKDWCISSGLSFKGLTEFGKTVTTEFGLETKVDKIEGRSVRFYQLKTEGV